MKSFIRHNLHLVLIALIHFTAGSTVIAYAVAWELSGSILMALLFSGLCFFIGLRLLILVIELFPKPKRNIQDTSEITLEDSIRSIEQKIE